MHAQSDPGKGELKNYLSVSSSHWENESHGHCTSQAQGSTLVCPQGAKAVTLLSAPEATAI